MVLLTLPVPESYAATISLFANLTGPNESPPNASPGIGTATVVLDTTAHSYFVSATFSGLLGTTTASHIHCCTSVPGLGTAGVATEVPAFTGFPLGVTSGTFSNTFSLLNPASYNPTFLNGFASIAAADAAFEAGLLGGTTYYNIHTTFAPGGEIRGFLAVAVPGPIVGAGLPGLVMSLGGFVAWARRRKATVIAA
jgi:hypothetical protein